MPRREICAFVTGSRRTQRVNPRDSVAGGGTVTRDRAGDMLERAHDAGFGERGRFAIVGLRGRNGAAVYYFPRSNANG